MRGLVPTLLLYCLAAATAALAKPIEVEAIDAPALAAASLEGHRPGEPLQVARGFPQKHLGIGAGLDDPGRWVQASSTHSRWTIEIEAPGALGIELLLSELHLPDHSSLELLDGSGRSLAVDLRGLRPGGSRLTPLVEGQRLRLTLETPTAKRAALRLRLASVLSAFLDPARVAAAKSGACNVDVACPEAADWRTQARGVAQLRIGDPELGVSCSGQLIANTAGSPRPLLLTANHCLRSPAQAQATTLYWNYRSPQCRPPGSASSGEPLPLSLASHVQSGAQLLATWSTSDFTLLELDAGVPDGAEAWWNGWDRRDRLPVGEVVTLHHPDGHEQRYSLSTLPTALSAYLGAAGSGSTHVRVARWTLGTMEPGSSGAGLWNADRRLVGQLHGGFAACGNSEPDWYGRLARSWEGGGSAQTRLRDHLDPLGTGAEAQDGYFACAAPQLSLQLQPHSPRVGETLRLLPVISGGQPPYRLDWDLDGDEQFELSSIDAQPVETRYPAPGSVQLSARVVDAVGCPSLVQQDVDVRGARLRLLAAEAPVAECGTQSVQRGGVYRMAVDLRNEGESGQALAALFAAARFGSDTPAADRHGHVLLDDQAGCRHDFIDISDSPALPLTPSGSVAAEDDGRSPPIALARSLDFYGVTVDRLVMSTNGYLSTAATATGGDFSNSCPPEPRRPSRDGDGGRIAVLHDDLAINPGGGLHHRWFDLCPRRAEAGPGGCHVFQWQNMGRFTPLGPNAASFQAVVYPDSGQWVFQYLTEPVANGAEATVGIQSPTHLDRALYSCNQSGRVRAGGAICLLPPSALLSDGRLPPLRLIEPVVELGSLASGETRRVELRFQVDPAADCQAPLGIEFLGAVEGAFASLPYAGGEAQRVAAWRGVQGDCAAASCPLPQRPWPAEGNAFDPRRAGNGIEQHVIRAPELAQAVYYGAWFTGDAQHLPVWYILQADYAGGQVQAPVLRFSSAALPDHPATSERVGDAQIGWIDAQRAILRWRIGNREGMETLRHAFADLPPTGRDRTGGWFNPAEPGWGLTVNSYGIGDQQRELVIAYLYDATGAPRWLLADAALDPASTPARLRQAHCPGCPWLARDPSQDAPAGQLGWRFTSAVEGVFSSQISLPPPLSGDWNRSALPLFLLTPPERP